MKKTAVPLEDETTMTEITIQPDGRVYVFGTSRQILDILVDLDPHSATLNNLMGRVQNIESGRNAAPGQETAAPSTRQE